MHPWIAATIMGSIAVLSAGSLVRSLRDGVARSFVQEYYLDENPVGYALCILGELGIIALGAAAILYACGLIGNPIDAINSILPSFLSCSHGDCPP